MNRVSTASGSERSFNKRLAGESRSLPLAVLTRFIVFFHFVEIA